jgi:hypothetical protein
MRVCSVLASKTCRNMSIMLSVMILFGQVEVHLHAFQIMTEQFQLVNADIVV